MFGFVRQQIGVHLHPQARPFEEFLISNPNTVVQASGSFNYSSTHHTPHIYGSNILPGTSPFNMIPSTIRPHYHTHR